MKRNLIAALSILVSLTLASCSKFTNGEPVTEQRSVDQPFHNISMYNNVNVKLEQSSHPRLELTCPKNLIDKVTTEVVGDTLFIKNENNFNWLRSFDYRIDLTVYYDSLREVNYASIGELKSIDTIRGVYELQLDTVVENDDTIVNEAYVPIFYLNINEGCGDIDLTLHCSVVKNNFGNGTSKVTLRGKSAYAEIIMRSYGVVHAEELNSNFVRVQSHSPNDAYVWARSKLTVWLYSVGNVYYKGEPEIIQEAVTGGGKLIPMQE